MQEAAEFRLRQGLILAFASVEGLPMGFSVAGEHVELDARQYGTTQLLAAYALGRDELSGRPSNRRAIALSGRQHEVLILASGGFKPHEIALQLGIGCHTADMDLRAVRERLGATSTLQAVAVGFRSGLIN